MFKMAAVGHLGFSKFQILAANHCNRLTDFDEIWYSDAQPDRLLNEILKIQNG